MLMPRVLQAKLPRIFGEPEEDVATGESIWGMITKSEDDPELAARPTEHDEAEADGVVQSSSERLLSTMGQGAPASSTVAASDRLLSSINQIPPAKDRSIPRRAGTPFPPRPKGERAVRPPKVTIQRPGASGATTKKALFETPLILEARDAQTPLERKVTGFGTISVPPAGPAKPKMIAVESEDVLDSTDQTPAKLSSIWRSEAPATSESPETSSPAKPAPASSSVLWQSDVSSAPKAVKVSTPRQTPIEPPVAKTVEPAEEIFVTPSPTPLDWGSPAPERSTINDALFPPTRPTIKFAPEAGRPTSADHDLLHTPFVIRRSRRSKALPIVLIAAGTLAFVLLNGVALYYMPKLLGERQGPLPMKGFISEPNVVATNAPAMQPVVSPATVGSASDVDSAAASRAPPAQLKPAEKLPEIAAAPSLVVPTPAVKPTAALKTAAAAITAPPEPKLKPALSESAETIAKPVIAKAAPAKTAPVKSAAVAPAAIPTLKAAPALAVTSPVVADPSEGSGVAPTAADGALVQIGAFASTAVADKGWRDVSTALPAEMAGKTRRVQPIPKGGATLYRTMVAGFSDREKAAQFCSDLKEKGLACFVRP